MNYKPGDIIIDMTCIIPDSHNTSNRSKELILHVPMARTVSCALLLHSFTLCTTNIRSAYVECSQYWYFLSWSIIIHRSKSFPRGTHGPWSTTSAKKTWTPVGRGWRDCGKCSRNRGAWAPEGTWNGSRNGGNNGIRLKEKEDCEIKAKEDSVENLLFRQFQLGFNNNNRVAFA